MADEEGHCRQGQRVPAVRGHGHHSDERVPELEVRHSGNSRLVCPAAQGVDECGDDSDDDGHHYCRCDGGRV